MLQQASPLEEVEHIGALDPKTVLAGFDLVGAAAVKKEIAEFDGATATIVQARADKRPRLDFLVGYNSGGRSAAGLDNAITHYKRDFSYVGLQLSWKLFDGFYTDSRIDYAVAKAEKQRWIIKQAQRDAEHAWQDKSSRVTELSEKVELAEKQLALSEAQRRIAEMRLATKRSSALQTRAAVNAVEDARDKVTGLKVDLFVARVEAMLARVN
jgi:outer membrane protein